MPQLERIPNLVGWSTSQRNVQPGYQQPYDSMAYGGQQPQGDIGVKARMVNLIGAVRTLMRGKI